MRFEAFGAWQAQIGPRPIMQDNVLVSGGDVPFAVVADGVGSVPDSEVAALLTVDTFASAARTVNDADDIAELMLGIADMAASRLLQTDSRAGSTTLAGAVVDASGRLWITHVGDSTVTAFTASGVAVSTRPHNEAEAARMGGSTEPHELTRTHVLTRSVRPTSRPTAPDVSVMQIREPTIVLAATDGVTGKLSLSEIHHKIFPPADDAAITRAESDFEDWQTWVDSCAIRLMATAENRCLDDNAALALLLVLPSDREPETA